MLISRRAFLQYTITSAAVARVSSASGQDTELRWWSPEDWGVEGRGWADQPRKRYYDRFPAKAEGVVRDAVWGLSRHSAGMAVCFETDASQIWVDYELFSDRLAMNHMPATGVSGVDLYAADADGTYRWVQVSRPEARQVKAQLVNGIDPGRRAYMLYLPLYNGVNALRIGVPASSMFQPRPPRDTGTILFYGTSIMHGACASRPGMAIPALVGRHLNRPTINVGFSGNGRMDPEVGDLLAELDVAAYCIDCLPNMNPALVRQRAVPLVKKLREARPTTPILLVEDRVFTNARFFASRRTFHEENHAALREAFEALRGEGCERLFYLPADKLLGDDGEGATDGSHPNDLGFMRYAAAYESVLKEMLAA